MEVEKKECNMVLYNVQPKLNHVPVGYTYMCNKT